MARQTSAKIQEYKGRHTLYLQKELVNDSAFPFKVGEDLVVEIEGEKLQISRPRKTK